MEAGFLAAGIRRVKGAKRPGIRVGNWLTIDQGRRLLAVSCSGTLKGKRWLEESAPLWSAATMEIRERAIGHLLSACGKLLLSDISPTVISRHQAARQKAGASNRTINMEVGALRMILRKHRLWANLQPDVRMLPRRSDIGRALSADEVSRLLAACKKRRGRSLYPVVLLSIHTGLRNGELRQLRWRQADLLNRTVTVGKSKTAGGEGRIIPLSDTAFKLLTSWRSEFPEASPEHFIFPSERYGLDGENGYLHGVQVRYDVRPEVPLGSWKVAWKRALATA